MRLPILGPRICERQIIERELGYCLKKRMTTMQNFDLSPLYRASIGFDQVSDLMNRVITNNSTTGSYPPYNIEKTANDFYRISIAVAGFSDSDLNVEIKNRTLIISGKKMMTKMKKISYIRVSPQEHLKELFI